ncbi:VOC family protein [Gemmatimonadota bacterium]
MTGDIPRGRFVWYDLMTSDLDAAVDFYTRLVGWSTAPWEGEGEPYTMWTNNGVPLGGVMPLPEEAKEAQAPPYWMAYVSVPDTKATVQKTEGLGGSVVVPATEIPNVGSFAILHDPQGGAFTAFTPLEAAPGVDDPPKVGEFSWHELATTDAGDAFDFYQAIFGWEKTEAMDMGAMGTYQMYGHGGPALGGMFNKPDEVEGPPAWLYYIRVDDANKTALTIQVLGGQVMSGPMEVPGGDLVAHCLDPQGGTFAIHSIASKEA